MSIFVPLKLSFPDEIMAILIAAARIEGIPLAAWCEHTIVSAARLTRKKSQLRAIEARKTAVNLKAEEIGQ